MDRQIEKEIKEFLETLNEAMAKNDLSVPEFAKLMGVSKHAVYHWLNGVNIMTLDKYLKAKKILKIK